MNRRIRELPVVPVAIAALVLGVCAQASADDEDELPFDVGKVFFQLNDTDQDLGIQLGVDLELT